MKEVVVAGISAQEGRCRMRGRRLRRRPTERSYWLHHVRAARLPLRTRYRLALYTDVAVLALVSTGCSDRPSSVNSSSVGTSPEAVVPAPEVLVVDGSGSMNTTDAPGPRIDAAKAAAVSLVDDLPDGVRLGLMTYGTSTGSAPGDKVAGCRDVTVLVPLERLDRDRVKDAVAGIVASGYTPLSLAMQQAVNQLPAGDSAQAVVLISDGEDTCDVPPCATAKQLKAQRPGLTISTVGFRLDGGAAEQLGCIAKVTGGLFVTADNTEQLAARLKATQDLNQAQSSLTASGLAGIELGQSIGDIRSARTDFPSVPSTGRTTVTWRDCDWTFADGVLTEIAPHDGGHTIDGVGPGTPLSRVAELYGKAITVETDGHGGYRLTYRAADNSDAAYRMIVEGYNDTGGTISGTVKTIVLCTCAGPRSPAAPPGPAVVNEQVIAAMTFPVGACGDGSRGWRNTVPITVVGGKGEARDANGDFAGASITDVELIGMLDANADGTQDVVVSFVCFGSPAAMCCAGRSSMMKFIGVYDFTDSAAPRPVGKTIMPGISPVRGESDGELRRIEAVRLSGPTIITDEKLIYPDTSGATADLGYPPDATVEVTHVFTDGQWKATERVRGQ